MKNDGTEKIRARYDRISPYYDLMELPLEKVIFPRWRKKVFDSLHGDSILEVGVGTGKNLDFYPVGKRITAIDFSQGMLRRARRKAESKGVKVDLVEMDVQDLHFNDQSLDTIFGTFIFCSVPDPIKGLREIKRVCKRTGRVILLEHVRPQSAFWGKIFDFMNRFTVKLMGVNINRDTVSNMKRAGLNVLEEKNLFQDVFKLLVASPRNA